MTFKTKYNKEIFIEKARALYGDMYDYSSVDYKDYMQKVKIICKKHGEFLQAPNKHLIGQGCRKCGYERLSDKKNITFDKFLERCKGIHGEKFQYIQDSYTNISSPVTIVCPVHGEFETEARYHYEGKTGCRKCGLERSANLRKMSQDEFIKRAKEKHGDTYDYSKVEYSIALKKITIVCKIHGKFQQVPAAHLQGNGCKKCADAQNGKNCRKSQEAFIQQSKRIFGDLFDYSKVVYVSIKTPIQLICKDHGIFERLPKTHIQDKAGCPKCNPIYQSNIGKEWLNYMKIRDGANIQHLGNLQNDGEHRILNSTYHADGYCKETNTIYEFHGSYWHGDPKKYAPDAINTHNMKPFGELYNNTLKKMKHCRQNGYTVVECWESDWRRAVKAIIQIQRKFMMYYYHNSS